MNPSTVPTSSRPTSSRSPAGDPTTVRADGEATVRALYGAVASGDVRAIADLLADDVVFHVPGRSPNAGDHRGRHGVLAFLARAAHVTGGTLALELRDVAAGREHVLALARYTASRDGKQLDNRLCHVLRLEGGRIAESWFFTGDQDAVDAFWND